MKRYLIPALLLLTSVAHAQPFVSQRPAPTNRLFISQAVEDKIDQVQRQLTNPRLVRLGQYPLRRAHPQTD